MSIEFYSLKDDSNKANRSVDIDEDESFIKPELPGLPESPIKDKVSEYIMNLKGKNR